MPCDIALKVTSNFTLLQVCIEMLAPGANLRPGLQNEASGVELSVEQESICSNYAEDETS